MRFKIGDRVLLLDKTCGPIRGLRGLLKSDFHHRDDLIPEFGFIKDVVEDGWNYGPHYKVQVEEYNHKIHKHKEFMFREEDLKYSITKWIADDLFVI